MPKHPRKFKNVSVQYWRNFERSKKRFYKLSLKSRINKEKAFQRKLDYMSVHKGWLPF